MTRPDAPPPVLRQRRKKDTTPDRATDAPRCFDPSSFLPEILAVHKGFDFLRRNVGHVARNRVVQRAHGVAKVHRVLHVVAREIGIQEPRAPGIARAKTVDHVDLELLAVQDLALVKHHRVPSPSQHVVNLAKRDGHDLAAEILVELPDNLFIRASIAENDFGIPLRGDEDIDVADDLRHHGFRFFRRPEVLAVVDIEAHQTAVPLGRGDELHGRLPATGGKARENAVGVGQPRPFEDFVPVEIAGGDRARRAALAVVNHRAGPGRGAEFDVVDAQPRAGNELDVRGVDPATHIVILRQQSQRIVGQFRDEGRFQSEPGDIAGHVALRSAHMNVERPRAADAARNAAATAATCPLPR